MGWTLIGMNLQRVPKGGIKQDDDLRVLGTQLQSGLARARAIEAAQSSPFKSGWLPAADWFGIAGLACEFLLRPLLPKALIVAGVQGVPLSSLGDFLFEPMLGLLGLGAARTRGSVIALW